MIDLIRFIVQQKTSFNDNLCPATTAQNFSINYHHCNYISIMYIIAAITNTSEGPSESDDRECSLSGGVIAAVAIVVLAVIVLVVTFMITICLIMLG